MTISVSLRSLAAAALLVAAAAPAQAQLYEAVGTRAQGMSGAFVAVADDATAVWWNPAGLATGALFNMVLERGRVTQPENPTASGPARRATTSGFSLAVPSLGLSYYRLRVSQIALTASTDLSDRNRQDVGGEVRSRALSQIGVTVGQSLWDHLVLGSTLKLIRGGQGGTTADMSRDLLDQGDDVQITQETHGDLD